MNFCKDCKFFTKDEQSSDFDSCSHPKNIKTHLVYGDISCIYSPYYLRHVSFLEQTINFTFFKPLCGKSGRWFKRVDRPKCVICDNYYAIEGNAYQDDVGQINWSEFECRKCHENKKKL